MKLATFRSKDKQRNKFYAGRFIPLEQNKGGILMTTSTKKTNKEYAVLIPSNEKPILVLNPLKVEYDTEGKCVAPKSVKIMEPNTENENIIFNKDEDVIIAPNVDMKLFMTKGKGGRIDQIEGYYKERYDVSPDIYRGRKIDESAARKWWTTKFDKFVVSYYYDSEGEKYRNIVFLDAEYIEENVIRAKSMLMVVDRDEELLEGVSEEEWAHRVYISTLDAFHRATKIQFLVEE